MYLLVTSLHMMHAIGVPFALYFAALNPFTHSDHDEQDGVCGETVTQQETQERPKPIPATRPSPPQVDSTGKKAEEKPQVPPLPVTRPVQPQAEGSEV